MVLSNIYIICVALEKARERFKSKIILPKKGYLIKIKFLTQVLEKIATPGYILSDIFQAGGGNNRVKVVREI